MRFKAPLFEINNVSHFRSSRNREVIATQQHFPQYPLSATYALRSYKTLFAYILKIAT